jgi:uncharacterized membrane protein
MSNGSRDKFSSMSQERTLTDISIKAAAILCYAGIWISGIIFLVLEQKNRFIRFHALQSIFVFGILVIASTILSHFPIVGPWFSGIVGLIGLILWIILMVKASQGELFKLPWVGDLAEKLAHDSIPDPPPPAQYRQDQSTVNSATAANAPLQPEAEQPPVQSAGIEQTIASYAVPPQPSEQSGNVPPYQSSTAGSGPAAQEYIAPQPQGSDYHHWHDYNHRSQEFKERYYSYRARTGRIVGSAFAIAWCLALIIFFNFYNQYIAFYHVINTSGRDIWEVYPLITADFHTWLPVINLALAVSIIGHAIMIAYDRYISRQLIHIAIDVFSLAAVITLVSIFPFDFSPIPNQAVIDGLNIGLPISLVIVSVCIGIGIMARFIAFIVHLAQKRY